MDPRSAYRHLKSKISENRFLSVVFIAALTLRLYTAIAAGTAHNNFYDMARYNEIALGSGISFAPPPGYPFFLRSVYTLFGALNYRAVYIAQSLLSAVSVLLVYLAASNVGSRRGALIAASVAALYPNFIVFNLITLTETIGVLFVVTLFLVLTGRRSDRGISILSSMTLCIGYFFRPSLIFFWPGTLWCVRRRRAFLAVTAIIIGAWVAYGAVSGKSSRRFARGFYKSYNTAQRGSIALEFKDTPLRRQDLSGSTYLESALDFIAHNKWETLDIIYYKLTVLVSRGRSNYTVSKMVRENRNLSQILYYCYLPVMALGFAGLVRLYGRRTRLLAIPMISYLFFNISLSIFKARYRLMIEPGLIIFGSLLIDERIARVGEWLYERRSGKSAGEG